jgi:hypothetical protein
LPQLLLQSSGSPEALEVQDTGADEQHPNVHHLRHQIMLPSNSRLSTVAKQIQAWSQADMTIDPVTFLPISMKYFTHSDNNSGVNIPVEVRYSNYQKVSGVVVPMHIERSVNGSLQLSIDIAAVTAN